jgi:hypothetical protein
VVQVKSQSGEADMATRRYGQNPQYRVILWSYRLICGALLVQLHSRTYRFRAYFVPTPQWHILAKPRAATGRVWEGEWLMRRTSEAMAVCINDQFKTISHFKLGKDGRKMVSYRRLADAQALGDLPIP